MAQTAQQGLQKVLSNIDSGEVKALFRLMGIELDFTRTSIMAVEEVINLHFRNSKNADHAIILLGAYLGETIVRNTPGAAWDTEDADDIFDIGIKIEMEGGEHAYIRPLVRVSKYQADPTDGIMIFYDTIDALNKKTVDFKNIADREWVETPFGRIRKSEYDTKTPPEHYN